MPVKTHATAPSTSAMPATTNPVPIPMSLNPILMSMPPIHLPQPHSSTAPRFNPQNPSTLITYLSDYESLAESTQLTPGERLAQSTRYLAEEDKSDWENLPEFIATLQDWDAFKEALFREYPSARKPFDSSADLDVFAEEKSKQEILTLDDYALFHQEFRRLATCLEKEKNIPDFCLNKVYQSSIHPDLCDKILFYLHDEKTLHERCEAFEVKQVREAAEHILPGFDYQFKSSRPLPSSKSTTPAPPVKTEISEVLNVITMMGQNLQMAMTAQMTSRTGPQTFQNGPAGKNDYQRQDRPRLGTAGTQCYMCHETAHFLRSCPILAEYTQLGKVSRNAQNLLILGNGDPIPNDLMNHSWAARVDDFYSRNPHLLKDPPLHMQANFAANLPEVHRERPLREEKSSLFDPLDSINEEDEELGLLGGKTEEEKLQLNRYIEVLQIKRKEMDSVKKSPDLPTSTPVWPMDAPLAEKTYLVPKTQAPSAKPLPSTPASVNPTPQFRYMAPIESKVNVLDVISWILS